MALETISGPAAEAFARQKAASGAEPFIPAAKRRELLAALEAAVRDHQDEIAEAVSRDFGNRSVHETKLLEVFPSISGLAHARKHLKKWMKPRRRGVSLWFFGARNRVVPQAKGVVGIIAPWNYPLYLVIGPLTCALAAGNRCMVKMAANAQNLCRLLDQIVSEKISREYVAFLPGVSASEFTPLPFDHLIFTGSPSSGRTVMKTAAEHLTPVTLELGGKSPTIISPDYDIDKAAERVLFIKYLNAGQTCVAPDYLFLPPDRVDAFVDRAKALIPQRYPDQSTPDYTAIIDDRAFERLNRALADAEEKGARVINLLPGAQPDPALQKIPPMLVLDVTDDMVLMQEEIFGPILPIKTYDHLDRVIEYVNDRPRPLALYLFTNRSDVIDRVVRETMSGGVGINDCAMHVAQHDLPFGGVGNSGMGQYHGREGFLEFSKLRPIFRQAPISAGAFMAPPYGRRFDRLYRWMNRFPWL